MLSMTGFGAATAEADGLRVRLEIAVVNHRGCQVSLRSELRDLTLEEELRRCVRERLRRGSATVQLTIERGDAGLDDEALRRGYRRLAILAAELGAPPPRLEEVARQVAHGAGAGDGSTPPAVAALARRALQQALEALHAMREREGGALVADLRRRMAKLLAFRAAVAERAPARLAVQRDALRQRLSEALARPIAEPELLRECALLADRLDLSEELTRLDSHLAQAGLCLGGGEDAGRRLEFLLQELGRECNTIGSKANDAAIAAQVVDAKTILEQIREQAANLL
jgi:uncharacterized protein YicC (UPF0701 family)